MVRCNSIEASTRSSMADFDDAKANSMEARIDAKFDAIQRTLSQISNQLGLRPIEAETSRQTPMVSFIEFPIFTGVDGDLKQWILWLEEFFVRERFTAMEKMNLAQSLLEDKAEAWFYKNQKILPFQSWEDLKFNLWLRFGDFADYDRFLQEIRVEKRRKRMLRTAVTPQESISSPATIPETITVAKFFNPQVNEISAEKKESKQEVDLRMEKIASQLKLPNTTVHVSDSENLRNIETRIENSVLDDFESVMKEAKIQTNIRLDVVNGDDERIQRVMSSSKNVSAHQVLDKMCQLKRLKPKNKRKPSLSPKSRMFKFKTKMLQRNISQMDPHHVMDSNIVTYMSSSSRAKFGFKWKEHNSRYWGRLRQTRLHMRHKWKSKHLRAVVGLQNNPSYALDVVIKPVLECNTTAAISQLVLERSVSHDCFLGSLWEKKSVSWLGLACVLAECMMHTTTVISAKLYSLFSFEVDTEENISSGLSQASQVWEPGGVLAEHILVDWSVDFHDYAEIVEGIRCLVIGVCSGIQQPIDSRRASRVWERGGVDIILVMHWLETLGTCVVVQRVNQKLAATYFGPYQVVERIGVVVFKDQTLPRKIAAALDSFAPLFVIVILVVIDRLSKAVHVLGLKHPFKPGWEIGVH